MANRKIDVYLELGPKRVFAGAVDWPGWSRAGRDEDAALEALVEHAERYTAAMREPHGFVVPADPDDLRIVERLAGDASTEFGVPGATPASDEHPLDATELERLVGLLRRAWVAFDDVAEAARGVDLAKGPRGGGRDLAKVVGHVRDAEAAYRRSAGGSQPPPAERDDEPIEAIRNGLVEAVEVRARGGPAPRETHGRLWTPRYAIRRSAWHALDHAWEIENRS